MLITVKLTQRFNRDWGYWLCSSFHFHAFD